MGDFVYHISSENKGPSCIHVIGLSLKIVVHVVG